MSYNVGFYSLDFDDTNYYIYRMVECIEANEEIHSWILNGYVKFTQAYCPYGVLLRIGYRDENDFYVEDENFKSLYYRFKEYQDTYKDFRIGVYYEYRGRTNTEAISEYNSLISLLRVYDLTPENMKLPIYIYNNYNREINDTKTTKKERTEAANVILKKLQETGYKAGLITYDKWFGEGYNMDQLYYSYDNPDDPTEVTTNNYSLIPIIDVNFPNVVNCLNNDGVLNIPYTPDELDSWPAVEFISNTGEWEGYAPDIPDTPEITIDEGTKIELDNAPLYPRSWSVKEANYKTGIYYIYSSIIKNNKIRITTSKDYIGDQSQISGWINITDIVDKSELQIGDKVEVTGNINTYADGSGNTINKNRETMYIIDILDTEKFKYNYAVAPSMLARRQGWADSSMIKKIVEIIDE